MRGKLLLAVGLAAGYVLGSRAGRKRYEQIKAAAQTVWETPRVQNSVDAAKDFAMSSIGDAGEKAIDEVKKLIAAATESARKAGGTSTSSKPAASSAKPAAKKPAARKPAAKKPAAKPAAQ